MKLRNVSLMFLVVLLTVGALLYAETESTDTRTIFGVRLDKNPIPDFVAKHLGLSSGQGFRVVNLHRDGPAHKAGIEKDDILVFQGEKIKDADEFVDMIRQSSPGAEIELDILHLGERKTIKVELDLFEGQGEYDWVYLMEPEFQGSRITRPGRAFRKSKEGWVQVPLDQVPRNVDLGLKAGIVDLFNEMYSSSYSDGNKDYAISIVGNPNNEDTKVFIRSGNTEYESTIKKMGNLPGQCRAIAEEAVQYARRSSTEAESEHQPNFGESYLPSSRNYIPATQFGTGESRSTSGLEKIEKQMRQLQQRLEKLEKLQEKVLDRLSNELKT